MRMLESKLDAPLSLSEEGTIRVGDTRVSLDSVVHHYRQGATAEEIALRFPALRLADIHSCLAYYLNHQDEVENYMERQRELAKKLKEQIYSDPRHREGLTRIRERINARKTEAAQKS